MNRFQKWLMSTRWFKQTAKKMGTLDVNHFTYKEVNICPLSPDWFSKIVCEVACLRGDFGKNSDGSYYLNEN